MKTVILCGGYGTRLSEETIIKPKPMVKIVEYITNWYGWKPSMTSLINIATIGIAIPNHLSLISNGAMMAEASIGVKFDGWGIILDRARIIPKKTK